MTEELERKAEQFAEKHAFRVPYDGSNKFYDDTDYKASKDGYIAGATEATKELQEEIEKLKYKEENYLQKIEHKDEVIETLKKCIEKMKSCSTCENSDEFGKCFNLLKVCRECVGYSNWQLKELAE